MQKKIIIDVTYPIIHIPSEFIKKFQRNKNHRKLKAGMIYDEPDICTPNSLIIFVEPKKNKDEK